MYYFLAKMYLKSWTILSSDARSYPQLTKNPILTLLFSVTKVIKFPEAITFFLSLKEGMLFWGE